MIKYEKWKQYQNYVVIAVISLIALFFIPMLGTEVGLSWTFPTTMAGWVVYVSTKLLVAAINILIFHCFVQQAKVNSLSHPNYMAATELLNELEPDHEEIPPSPTEYFRGVYGKKGALVFITSALSAVSLTQAVLTFDLVSMLTYLFTIILGVIAGLLEMAKDEIYWQQTYLQYAKYAKANAKRKEAEMANKAKMDVEVVETQLPNPENDTTSDIGGTVVLESIDSDSPSCPVI